MRRFDAGMFQGMVGVVCGGKGLHGVENAGILKMRSTNKKGLPELTCKPLIIWSWREDLNPRPADYKLEKRHF